MTDPRNEPQGLISRIVRPFVTSRLSILLIMAAVAMGAAAIMVTPREEDPQIVVPLADVFVLAPGASAEEVEKLVATPLERLLWQIDGVEYVYSTSRRDMAVVTVRFFVGEDRERSLVKLHNKIAMNEDQAPPLVRSWVIKPVEIDDVPILNITLYSDRYSDHELRRIGEEVCARLSEVEDISRADIVGGRKREVRVELLPERMAGMGTSALAVVRALEATDASVSAGSFDRSNRDIAVTSDSFVVSAEEVKRLVVGVHAGRPVYLENVAHVLDGPEEMQHITRIGFSRLHRERVGLAGTVEEAPAVTLALAKKKGTNAVWVARRILDRVKELEHDVIPDGVRMEVTRNYGHTAQEKVNDLLASLAFAILTVVGLLALTMGWREALVVALAVPISFSLALFVNYLFGFTINRVTLFALILSLGLVVDDPITNVDNIQRHVLARKQNPLQATLFAVNEVLPPVIMSTLAIIVSFTPMFFITGMMGPYMAPMAANVPLTVTFSTLCALTVVPWLAHLLLKRQSEGPGPGGRARDEAPEWIERFYGAVVSPFLASRTLRLLLAAFILAALAGSAALALFRQVPLKMLPFDNKNEFQIVLDMPEGTPLEATDRVVRDMESFLRSVPEVTTFVSYVGTSSPMDFNGMVRHYYLRQGGHLADIRVNLLSRQKRLQQSHEIVLRLRKGLETVATRHDVRMKLVETPPGPPVVATLVAEVYPAPDLTHDQLIHGARHVRNVMSEEPFVVDVDDTVEEARIRLDFVLDKEKAALHGVSSELVTHSLRIALAGMSPAFVHLPDERRPLRVQVVLPREIRSSVVGLGRLPIQTGAGTTVPLTELGSFEETPEDQPIYHKNLQRVVYVFGETAGRSPAEAVLDMQDRLKREPPPEGVRVDWTGEGEWKITLRVFRDLGIANAVALIGIYLLLVIQLNAFGLPLLIMVSVPLTVIGIMPGFWFLNQVLASPVGGFENPIFFTATSMIGMIALGGIVIRNSLVLLEFIQGELKEGRPLRDAILRSGAIRFRPIVLTAATTALGAWPITLDPIFSGLAWALIFGLFASTAFTLVVVPVAYYALNRRRLAEGALIERPQEG